MCRGVADQRYIAGNVVCADHHGDYKDGEVHDASTSRLLHTVRILQAVIQKASRIEERDRREGIQKRSIGSPTSQNRDVGHPHGLRGGGPLPRW
jgi:hypothetical protein